MFYTIHLGLIVAVVVLSLVNRYHGANPAKGPYHTSQLNRVAQTDILRY